MPESIHVKSSVGASASAGASSWLMGVPNVPPHGRFSLNTSCPQDARSQLRGWIGSWLLSGSGRLRQHAHRIGGPVTQREATVVRGTHPASACRWGPVRKHAQALPGVSGEFSAQAFAQSRVPKNLPSQVAADRHLRGRSQTQRRGGDSNPRDPCGPTGFRDRPIRPLWHLSEGSHSGRLETLARRC